MLTADGEASEQLIFYTDFPRMHQDGIKLLEERIKIISDLRLVIIDTLGKFRPPKPKNAIQYDFDYEVGAALKDLADKREVSILIIHHMRKTESEDRFDDVIGSFGVTGTADGVMLLIRKTGQVEAELRITGRDIEEAELALNFDSRFLAWNVTGDIHQKVKTNRQREIIDILKESQFSMSPKEISEASGLDSGYVRKTLKRLSKQGVITQTEYGRYEILSI
jgi:predicted transcriptional regulator